MTIVEELRTNRESGAKRLEAEYKAGLMTLARRFCTDEGDAEELVNRTFAAVVEGIDDYLEQSAFFGWMCQILSNIHAKDIRKKSHGIVVYPGVVPDVIDEDAEDRIFQEIDASLLHDAIENLPKEMQEAIVLHYFTGLSVQKIAKFLAIPEGTVKSRLHYARLTLGAKLGANMKKPGGKAVLLALLLCGITALGAAVWNIAASSGEAQTPADASTSHVASRMSSSEAEASGQATSDMQQTEASNLSTSQPFNFSTDFSGEQTMNKTQTTRAAAMLAAATIATSAALPATDAVGDTLTWIGGASGLMSSATNWTSDGLHASPQPGDIMQFHKAVTLEHESFDLGAAGLTFESDYELANHVSFSGTGGIVKNGSGDLVIYEDTQGTFAGDVVFNAGRLILSASGSNKRVSFGTGKMVFTQSETAQPSIYEDVYGPTFLNAVELRGHCSGTSIQLIQTATLSGDISSRHDFTISIGYKALNISGNISAPGRTLTAWYAGSGGNAATSPSTYSGVIDASFVKTGNGNASRANTYLSGRSDFLSNSLTVLAGTNVITSSGYWGGTNVVVNGNSAVLRLEGVQNLSHLANVELINGGKLDLSAGCAVRVAGLFVGDAWQEDGTYTAMNYPEAIHGAGSITVSSIAVDAIWCGGATGLWSDSGNWSCGATPASGATVLFTNAVELTHETVDFGTDGVTVFSDFDITNHVWFTGAGRLIKKGSGRFVLRGDAGGDFTGGAVFEDGVLVLDNRNYSGNDRNGYRFFGSGPVTLVSSGSLRPYINFDEWDSGLTNTIAIQGTNIGENRQGAIYAHQPVNTIGPIVADSDFNVFESYYGLNLSSIDAPGHTVFVDSYRAATVSSVEVILNGTVNANVTKSTRPEPLTINGYSPATGNTLTLQGGTNTLSSAAYWGGNVIVSGSKTQLALQGNGILSERASLAIDTTGGATIGIPAGVKVRVGEFFVNGVKMGAAVYSSGNLPGVVTGAGHLVVGTPGMTIVFR
ncbi:MAG: sigma-70 family RNA polymerase sigma factor [Kiritimatiellae bacterium]|nr:sigma-70 family RNA polymerase sigma factor [Kiritimatiellia bacterium]